MHEILVLVESCKIYVGSPEAGKVQDNIGCGMVANMYHKGIPHGPHTALQLSLFLGESTDEQPVKVTKRVLMKQGISAHIP